LTNHNVVPHEVIFFDYGPPESYDPLDADITINLFSMRNLYATPLEITPSNTLASSLLDSFQYDTKEKKLIWIVKKDIYFSDGTEISVNDIVFSVLRMAYRRPQYPVIKFILGLDAWLSEKDPLTKMPKGIRVSERKIEILFSKHMENAMFRFALEIFSIIPKKCVDLVSNKINCQIPPQSGYYSLVESNEKRHVFKMRKDPFPFHGYSAPKNLIFSYKEPSELRSENFNLAPHSVVFGNEFRLKTDDLMDLPNRLHFKYLPSALFRFLLINPNIPPFDSLGCRLIFSHEIRQVAKSLINGNFNVSGSLFPAILPGFMDDEQLSNVENQSLDYDCLKKLRETEFPWVKTKKIKNSFEDELINQVVKRLGLKKVKIFEVSIASERDQLYMENKNSFIFAGSGFWAQEPLGDLQMFFSPGMHPLLRDVIADLEVKRELSKLDEINEGNINNYFMKLNEVIYKTSILSVFLHTRRFYAGTSSKEIRDLPQAVVAPATWQVFNIED